MYVIQPAVRYTTICTQYDHLYAIQPSVRYSTICTLYNHHYAIYNHLYATRQSVHCTTLCHNTTIFTLYDHLNAKRPFERNTTVYLTGAEVPPAPGWSDPLPLWGLK